MKPSKAQQENSEFAEYVVKINRCATVVKGGRRFSFSALVVVGNRNGEVGVGFGKANEVPPAVQKALKDARRSMVKVSMKGDTIPHQIIGKYRATRIFLKPAMPGTGVIAGGSVRAIIQAAGIKNILSKVYGSNPVNLTKATLNGLLQLRDKDHVSKLRGMQL